MKAVTEANPYIDRFHYYEDDFSSIAATLKQENFDYVIDLHKNFRTYRLRLHIKAKWFAYRKETVGKFLLTNFRINKMSGRGITQRAMDTIKPLGVKDDGRGPDYFIPAGEKVQEHDLPASHLAGYVAIVIGASYFTKKLPVAKLIELCKSIPFPIMLLGGKEDAAEGAEIAAFDNIKVYNSCGKFSLNESADLVRRSLMVISHDTGLAHIAAAFNKKVLSIWGGTVPELGFAPYYGSENLNPPQLNFVVPGLPCQPCSNFGKKQCPKGHFKCMNNQDMQLISDTVVRYLKKK